MTIKQDNFLLRKHENENLEAITILVSYKIKYQYRITYLKKFPLN